MITPTVLALYIVLGLFFSFLIYIFPDQFMHIMGWSLLRVKRAQLQNEKVEKEVFEEKIDQYEDSLIEEMDKPAPSPEIGIFYIFILIVAWPFILVIPIIAFLIDIFYLND